MNKHKPADSNHFFARWQRQIQYAWHNVFNDIRQHLFASLLTMMVLAISIALPTVCYLLWKNANDAAQQWYPTPNLTAYLDKDLNENAIHTLQEQIQALEQVEKIDYLSRLQTLEEFREWSGFSDALTLLADNPLPAVIIIMPTEQAKQQTASLHQLQQKVQTLKGVSDVRLDDSWFTRLTALTKMVETVVWIISLFMITALFLVISNSIRLTIAARRQTITVLQLIGATEGFILRPFLYSGMFHGLVSAVVALLMAELFILQMDSMILEVSAVFGTKFTLTGLTIDETGFIMLLATIIGWLSACLATKRYLKLLRVSN